MDIRSSRLVTAMVAVASTEIASVQNAPTKFIVIDQSVDQATKQPYNHMEQGTRLIPAAHVCF